MWANPRKKVEWTLVACATMFLWVVAFRGIEPLFTTVGAFFWTIILIGVTAEWYAEENKPKRNDGN